MSFWLNALQAAQGLFNIGAKGYNIYANERQRNDQLAINEQNWQRQQYADELSWQRQQQMNDLNWERSQQLTEMQNARDDNAVQRRVADLKAAGLSPILAAGQGASTSAPIKAEAHASQAHGSQGSGTGTMQLTPMDFMSMMLQRANYDHSKADEARIRTQIRLEEARDARQALLDKERLKDLRNQNRAFEPRFKEERAQWLRNQTQFARDGETWAIDLANKHQNVLTMKLRTEREAHEYQRLLEQGGHEVSNHIWHATMNVLRANNRATSDWFERDLNELSRIALHTRLPYENVMQAMERIARERNYHAMTIDHLFWINQRARSNE